MPNFFQALLGYIPEQVELYPRLSGLKNLRYFAALSNVDELDRGRLIEALTRAGLPVDSVDQRVAKYSKGMRQKVVIALAIVRRIRGLLLDEPTSGLDPQAAHDFSQIIRQLSDDGVAVLMASHDLYHARESATRAQAHRYSHFERLPFRSIGNFARDSSRVCSLPGRRLLGRRFPAAVRIHS